MRTTLFSGAVALCLSGFALPSNAASLLFDNFDGYANQAAFEASWTVVTAPSGVLVSTQSVSSANSIYYANNASNVQRNQKTFAESGNPALNNTIRFSFDFYDSDAAASPYRQYANLQDGTGPTGAAQLISLGLNNNQLSTASGGNYYMARILSYSPATVDPDGGPNEGGTLGSGAYFKLNDFGVGLRSTGWHNLAVEISPTQFSFFVDGLLAETVANTLTLRSYETIRLGSGLSSARSAWFDNLSVSTIVPEPSSLAFALLGGFGLFFGRMRRQ